MLTLFGLAMGEVNCRQGLWKTERKITTAGQSTCSSLGGFPWRWLGDPLCRISCAIGTKMIPGLWHAYDQFCSWLVSPIYSDRYFMLLVFRKVIPKLCICIKLGWSFKSPLFYETFSFIFSNDKTSDYKNEMCLYKYTNLFFKMRVPALITLTKQWEGYSVVRGRGRILLVYGRGTDICGRGCSFITMWRSVFSFQEPGVSPRESPDSF